MLKILWVTNMPTIYRVNFFNELGKYCDLTVLFERYSATGVKNKWNNRLAKTFKPIFVKTRAFGREGSLSLGLLKQNLKNYDEIVISSYSSPSEMLLILKLKLMRIPYILEVDGGIIKSDIFLKKKIKSIFISGASLYYSTSDSTNEYLKHYGADPSKIKKYHFSSLENSDIIDINNLYIDKYELKKKLGINEPQMILSVGQFIYRKGFDYMLMAYNQLNHDVAIVIIGGIPTEEYLKIVDKYNMTNVYFISEISKEKLSEYYLAADIFVLPTREDIWGLVINEAMGKGLPIITTNKCVAGLELIENGNNGFIIDCEDEEELREKTLYLLNNDNIRKKMSINNIDKIKNFTIQNMAKEHYEEFLRRSTNGKSKS